MPLAIQPCKRGEVQWRVQNDVVVEHAAVRSIVARRRWTGNVDLLRMGDGRGLRGVGRRAFRHRSVGQRDVFTILVGLGRPLRVRGADLPCVNTSGGITANAASTATPIETLQINEFMRILLNG